MVTLLLSTRNAHKIAEIRAILGPGFSYRTLNDFPDAPKVHEDAATFAGNATKKAVELARWIASIPAGRAQVGPLAFVLADDSGLEVDALNGAPGVHSARFAALDHSTAGNSSDSENNAKLLRLLKDVPVKKRTARFRCVLALTPVLDLPPKSASPTCDADPFELQTELFEGACEGRVGFEPRGNGGFGYDPLFMPNGYTEAFAELGEQVKNGMSHRAVALARLRTRLERL